MEMGKIMKLTDISRNDPALYADMKAYLQSGEWETAYESDTALWLRRKQGWLSAIAALDLTEAGEILRQLPSDGAMVLRGCPGLRALAEGLGFDGCEPCWQAVYEKQTLLPVTTELVIRHPDAQDFPRFRDSYDLGGGDELRRDFDRPDFLGGYLDGAFVGYIGLHGEGSMGLLHVFPEYRRRGYAEALYSTLINNQLKKGRLPFAQIIEGNEASLALQRKLGFTLSRDLIYWMWREE